MNIPKQFDPKLALWGWVAWIICLAIILLLILKIQPEIQQATGKSQDRSVTSNYADAARDWWAGSDLYTTTISGFLYFPQAAILYTPFAFLPPKAGEAAWRIAITLLLASAVYRLAKATGGQAWPVVFLVATLLSIPPGAGSLRNGQMNIPLAALMIHGMIDLAQRRWTRSATLLVLALALKPLALVLILLVAALYPRQMIWRLGVGLLVMLMAPFILQPKLFVLDTDYVLDQYYKCAWKLRVAGAPERFFPADLSGMLRSWHIVPPVRVMLVIRFLAALGTLGICAVALWRWRAAWGAILILTFAAAYLMLFNPRTENNSYIILAPMVAALAGAMLFLEGRGWEFGGLVAACLCLGFAQTITHGETHWLRPVVTILFLLYLTYLTVIRQPPGETGEPETKVVGITDGPAAA